MILNLTAEKLRYSIQYIEAQRTTVYRSAEKMTIEDKTREGQAI